MGLDALSDALPSYARDTRLNLGSVLTTGSVLTEQQRWGTALAVAVAAGNPKVLAEISEAASDKLSEAAFTAAKSAASIMAMNNVYYRAKHLIGDAYALLPARLRMQVIADPGVDQVDFELWSLAVSAVNGCGVCLQSHEKTLRNANTSREAIHDVVRIAAVINAAATALTAESALAHA